MVSILYDGNVSIRSRVLKLEHYGFFYLRTPVLPLSWAERIFAATDPSLLIEEALKDRKIRTILWSAAPKLLKAREAKNAPDPDLDLKLSEYLLRAATRATPNGLLSACSLGKISQSQARLDCITQVREKVAVDLDVVIQEKIAAGYSKPDYVPEKQISLHPAAKLIENLVTIPIDEESGKWKKIKLRADIFSFLQSLQGHSLTGSQLVRKISKHFKTPSKASVELIRSLLKSEVLVQARESSVIAETPGVRGHFLPESLRETLTAPLDAIHLKDPFEHGEKTEDLVRSYHERFPGENRPLHFELTREHEPLQLSERQISDLSHAFSILNDLLHKQLQITGTVADIRRTALETYQAHDSGFIPLNEFLGLYTRIDPTAVAAETRFDETNRTFLQTHLQELQQKPSCEGSSWIWQLSRKELPPELAKQTSSEALSLAATLQFVRSDGQDLIWLKGVTGGTATSKLSRFAHFHDELREKLQLVVKKEAELFGHCVDVAYRLKGAAHNMHRRPTLFDREIDCNEFAQKPDGKRIPLSDLLVTSQNDSLQLYSKSLRSIIRPVHSSPIEVTQSRFHTIRLLTLMGMQNWASSLQWIWPGIKGTHFPRVQVGNVILSPEEWRIPRKELSAILQKEKNPYEILRSRWKLPRRVYVTELDRYFPIDLSSELGIAFLKDQLPEGDEIRLYEYFEDSQVRFGSQSYAAEAIIPLYRHGNSQFKNPKLHPQISIRDPRRVLVPSSKCAYFTLSCNERAHDQILLKLQREIVSKLKPGTVSKWFYVRYDYPSCHLRLRFFLNGDLGARLKTSAKLLKTFELWLRQGWISKIEQTTYQREVELYGGVSGTELFETFSSVDSEWMLDFLSLHENHWEDLSALGSWSSQAHIENAYVRTVTWFKAMKLSREEITAFLAQQKNYSTPPRHPLTDENKQALREFYRAQRSDWASYLNGNLANDRWKAYDNLSRKYLKKYEALYRKWNKLHSEGQIQMTREELLGRLVHMGINRTGLRVDHPHEQELCAWTLKAYQASLHQKNESAKNHPALQRPEVETT